MHLIADVIALAEITRTSNKVKPSEATGRPFRDGVGW